MPLFFDPHVGCAYIRVCASNKECGSITAFTLCLINLVQILKINKYAYSKDMYRFYIERNFTGDHPESETVEGILFISIYIASLKCS